MRVSIDCHGKARESGSEVMGMGAKLTDKQEKFIQELIKGKSQREAYKEAYPKSRKWTDNAVDARACRLFHTDKVLTRYKELQDRLKKEAEDEAIITAKEVLKEFAKIGRADIKDYLSFRTGKTIIGHEDGEPIIDYAHVVEMKDSEQVDGSLISEVQLKDGTLKFKLHDKVKALENIARHLGMYIDKTEVTGKDGGPIEIEDARNKLIEELVKKRTSRADSTDD